MDITPALNESEWEDCELTWPTVALSTTTGGEVSVWDGEIDGASMHVRVAEKDRHALAALALYKQEYGFTQEDVTRLREEHGHLMSVREGGEGSSHARWLKSLADRIAALLPPPK